MLKYLSAISVVAVGVLQFTSDIILDNCWKIVLKQGTYNRYIDAKIRAYKEIENEDD